MQDKYENLSDYGHYVCARSQFGRNQVLVKRLGLSGAPHPSLFTSKPAKDQEVVDAFP